MRSFYIFPQAHSSSSIVAIYWPTHQLWKSKSEIRLATPSQKQHITHTANASIGTHTSRCAVFQLLLLDTQTCMHYSTVCKSWLTWLRFQSSRDPVFKAVTSGCNLLNRQKRLHLHRHAKKGPWNCPHRLPYNSVEPLNQKKLILHSGLSVWIISDPKGCAGSV